MVRTSNNFNISNWKLEGRRLFSELLGTFFLVLVAAGADMMGHAFPDTISRAAAVVAPGLTPQETARRLELYNTRINFGSNLLFEPELSIGYRFSERLAAELSWVHISNAQIFHQGKNQGLDDAGVRLIYSF